MGETVSSVNMVSNLHCSLGSLSRMFFVLALERCSSLVLTVDVSLLQFE